MKLSRRADYGMRLILDLAALEDGERTSSREVARRKVIPLPFLNKIIPQLAIAGLVETQRGTNGGIRLACPAGQISMKDVLEALEGPIVLNHCLTHPQECPLQGLCPVCDVWQEVQTQVSTTLAEITFAELLQRQQVK